MPFTLIPPFPLVSFMPEWVWLAWRDQWQKVFDPPTLSKKCLSSGQEDLSVMDREVFNWNTSCFQIDLIAMVSFGWLWQDAEMNVYTPYPRCHLSLSFFLIAFSQKWKKKKASEELEFYFRVISRRVFLRNWRSQLQELSLENGCRRLLNHSSGQWQFLLLLWEARRLPSSVSQSSIDAFQLRIPVWGNGLGSEHFSVTASTVLSFVSRGCWRDAAWRWGLLSLFRLLHFAFPCSCFVVCQWCVCVCVCVCVYSGGHLLVLYLRCAPEWAVHWWRHRCVLNLASALPGWHWYTPSLMLAVAPLFLLQVCPPALLACAQKVPYNGPTMDACAPGFIPVVVFCFLLCAHSRASVRLLPGGLSLALLLLWTNSGRQTRKHSHYPVGCNHSFFNEIFKHALRRRLSIQISSSLCTVQGTCLPLSQVK